MHLASRAFDIAEGPDKTRPADSEQHTAHTCPHSHEQHASQHASCCAGSRTWVRHAGPKKHSSTAPCIACQLLIVTTYRQQQGTGVRVVSAHSPSRTYQADTAQQEQHINKLQTQQTDGSLTCAAQLRFPCCHQQLCIRISTQNCAGPAQFCVLAPALP